MCCFIVSMAFKTDPNIKIYVSLWWTSSSYHHGISSYSLLHSCYARSLSVFVHFALLPFKHTFNCIWSIVISVPCNFSYFLVVFVFLYTFLSLSLFVYPTLLISAKAKKSPFYVNTAHSSHDLVYDARVDRCSHSISEGGLLSEQTNTIKTEYNLCALFILARTLQPHPLQHHYNDNGSAAVVVSACC